MISMKKEKREGGRVCKDFFLFFFLAFLWNDFLEGLFVSSERKIEAITGL